MRLTLWCHGSTPAVRAASFPDDEPLDPYGRTGAEEIAPTLGRLDRVHTAGSRRCRETAAAAGLPAVDEPTLQGCDHGDWTGRTIEEVAALDPAGLRAWLHDPHAAPHGGESLAAVIARVGAWVESRTGAEAGAAEEGAPAGRAPADGSERLLLAVVDPVVARAAVVHALGAPPAAIRRVELAPLARTLLVGGPGRWALRAVAVV